MPHTLRPALAMLAAGGLLFLSGNDLAAQNAAAKKTKKAPIQPVQARDDDQALEAPPPRAKNSAPANAGTKRRAAPVEESNAAEPATKRPAARQPRPEMQPDRVEKLSPELEKLLKDWEEQSSTFKKLVGDFRRYKYDNTFSVEFRAEGKFAYEAPDKGYYQFDGAEIPSGTVSKKKYRALDPKTKEVTEVPYSLKPDTTEHWVCDGMQIFKINDRDKQFERVPIPPESQGQNIIDGPLPFLFGMKVDRAKRRYTFEMLPPKTDFKDTVWLLVRPKTQMDASNWSEARVGINRNTFLPVAVMLTDPAGTSETVHLFSKVQVNPEEKFFGKLFGAANPFKPDLKKYKMIQNDKPGPIDAEPVSQGVGARPAAGTGGRTSASDRNDRDLPRSADASAGGTRPAATKAGRK